MNPEVITLCEAVREAGGRAMLVGGTVRDRLLGMESKDFDIEVYGLEPSRLRAVLELIGRVNTVGEHFSVYKLVFNRPAPAGNSLESKAAPAQKFEIDVSLPRRESKSGRGHRGFVIEGDPKMSFEEAARRRDFTINAMLYDPLTGETVDPFGGRQDFERRILKAVAADTFVEDSLRVLRAVQLVARLELTIEPPTVELCRTIDLSDLPRERIWGEIEKLLTLAERPSIGLDAALELGALDQILPELRPPAGGNQTEGAKSERDAFTHTKLSLDEAVALARGLSKPERIAVMLATLFHEIEESPGVDAARRALDKMGVYGVEGYDVRSQVLALVRDHLKPLEFYESRDTITDGDFRRLAQRVDIDLLYRVAKACAMAQGSASAIAEEWFIEKARALGVDRRPPAPLLQGRHLLEAGIEPGPRMGRLLRQVYELQLDGKVTTLEEALAAALRGALTPL